MAFNITFDLSSLQQPLPDQVIFGIAYNTESAGQAPTGIDGPYDDLNVGLNATNTNAVPGASNPLQPQPYMNSSIPGNYADNGAGGVNVFRLDVGNNVPNIAIEFNVPAASPTSITVAGMAAQAAMVGAQFEAPLQAKVTDMGGNPFPGVTVTFAAPPSGASAMLSSTQVMTDSNGVASVTATANTKPGTYPVTASVAGVTAPATFNLTNVAGPATAPSLLSSSPTTRRRAARSLPAVTVSLKDANQNPIVNAPITLSIPGGLAIAGATANTDTTGIATFSALTIQQAGTYQLQASGGGLTSLAQRILHDQPRARPGGAFHHAVKRLQPDNCSWNGLYVAPEGAGTGRFHEPDSRSAGDLRRSFQRSQCQLREFGYRDDRCQWHCHFAGYDGERTARNLPGHGIHHGRSDCSNLQSDQCGRSSQRAYLHPAAD